MVPFKFNLALFAVACSSYLAACQPELPDISGSTMGTTYSLQLPRLNETDQHKLISSEVETLLREINSAMSTYQSDSAISLFNRSESLLWSPVPDSFAMVADYALSVARQSRGALDPTVGPLVRRWGFGAEIVTVPPPENELEKLLEHTGYQQLQVQLEPPSLRKLKPQIQIDLSAIAKGYAVDKIADLVETYGFKNYLVEIGGELRGRGNNRHNEPWTIGIEQPDAEGIVVKQALTLTAGGVATSGDYRNFIEADGVRYSHIIDPRTGYPVTHLLAAVTVVAESAMQADAWATALMVLGVEEGLRTADHQQLAAYFIYRNDNGLVGVASSKFAKLDIQQSVSGN